MIGERIAILESSHIKDTASEITPKKEPPHNHYLSEAEVTPSPKSINEFPMDSSSTSAIEGSSFISDGEFNSSKDRLETDDDTVSSSSVDDADLESNDVEVDSYEPAHEFLYHIFDTNTMSVMDKKQLFFPPNYTNNEDEGKQDTNNTEYKATIPSYFLCQITNQIMIDPVIDYEGNTYERHAILRWLVLYQNTSPVTGNALCMDDLRQDTLVKVAIDKARKDAWVKYILNLNMMEESDVDAEDEESEIKEDTLFEGMNSFEEKLKGKQSDSAPKQLEQSEKSDLEIYLDCDRSTEGSSCNESIQSATNESKNSDHSTDSQGKQEMKVFATTSQPLTSNMEQLPPLIRPDTPPPSDLLPQIGERNPSIKSVKSTKSSASSASTRQETCISSERSPENPIISSISLPSKAALFSPPTSSSLPVTSSNTSMSTTMSIGTDNVHNGWTVPLGVHKVICSSPGLVVSTHVHRRSTPVKRTVRDINNNCVEKDLILVPGSFVEILETQVHGGRVRGRILLEEEDLEKSGNGQKKKKSKKKKKSLLDKRLKRKSKIFQRGRAKKKTGDEESYVGGHDEMLSADNLVKYSGWISLQWADDDEDVDVATRLGNEVDEDAGPWTEHIPLGVYRISIGAGLPLRETPERDSTVLEKLERGRCVEVVETKVKDDRVRARCLFPQLPQDGGEVSTDQKTKSVQTGWISLVNTLTGASSASPVPHGVYVAVAESGCIVTEGVRLDSTEKGAISTGSCFEVVATRLEEGLVRGLISSGGHVTLFVLNEASSNKVETIDGRMFAMPVPLGTYQVLQNGLSVTSGLSRNSPVITKLKLDACAEIAETRMEGARVRGRITAVGYDGVAKEASGWISLFEPTQRWAKIVCFKGGKPILQNKEGKGLCPA